MGLICHHHNCARMRRLGCLRVALFRFCALRHGVRGASPSPLSPIQHSKPGIQAQLARIYPWEGRVQDIPLPLRVELAGYAAGTVFVLIGAFMLVFGGSGG